MSNISADAELSMRYTNHCVRSSTITHLFQQGVPVTEIRMLTKHKNSETLKHYINDLSEDQKQNHSGILMNTLSSASGASNSVSIDDDITMYEFDSDPVYVVEAPQHGIVQAPQHGIVQAAQHIDQNNPNFDLKLSENNLHHSLFYNPTFNNCTFHVYH